MLVLITATACAETDSNDQVVERAACIELVDEASVASYQELPVLADELVADQCTYDELLHDLSLELIYAVETEDLDASDDLHALAEATRILIQPLLGEEHWRRSCTNAMWETAYENLIYKFGYSSDEAFVLANKACSPAME